MLRWRWRWTLSAREREEPLATTREGNSGGVARLAAPVRRRHSVASFWREDDLGIDDTAELIKADAALSADVLRLANSPLFGLRQRAAGILHAVALLGLSRVMTLVMTAAMQSFANRARGNRCAAALLASQSGLRPDL